LSTLQKFTITVYDGSADGVPDQVEAGYYFVENGTVYLTDAFGRVRARQKLYKQDAAETVARSLWQGKYGRGRDYRHADIPIRYGDPRYVAPV
jgi:hypothetical protein